MESYVNGIQDIRAHNCGAIDIELLIHLKGEESWINNCFYRKYFGYFCLVIKHLSQQCKIRVLKTSI